MNYKLNYEIGSYVTIKGQNIARIEELTREFVTLVDKEGIEAKIMYKDVYPIALNSLTLKLFGIREFRKTSYTLHNDILYELNTGINVIHLRQLEFKDNSMWLISQLRFKYLHEIQNYLKLLNPESNLSLIR